MNNPLNAVKHTRTTYSKRYQKNYVEVLVQFADEPEAWIPLETLLALKKL
jgi:hypothetical protein